MPKESNELLKVDIAMDKEEFRYVTILASKCMHCVNNYRMHNIHVVNVYSSECFECTKSRNCQRSKPLYTKNIWRQVWLGFSYYKYYPELFKSDSTVTYSLVSMKRYNSNFIVLSICDA